MSYPHRVRQSQASSQFCLAFLRADILRPFQALLHSSSNTNNVKNFLKIFQKSEVCTYVQAKLLRSEVYLTASEVSACAKVAVSLRDRLDSALSFRHASRATCLAAARSRSRSNSPPDCYSLRSRRFATCIGEGITGGTREIRQPLSLRYCGDSSP